MSSKKRSRKIRFKDERAKNLVKEWTTSQGWQLEDFATFISLIKLNTPVELAFNNSEGLATISAHQVETNEDVLIKLTLGKDEDKPSTITVAKGEKAEIYEVLYKGERDTTPKVDLRYVTINDGVKKTVFLFYQGTAYAVKSIEGKEEVSVSSLTNKWKFKDEEAEILFDMVTRKYVITLQSDEKKVESIDLLEMIRNAIGKVSSLRHLII